jgi:hypothetical protein|tara:strand:- start:72 stop:452 length:381 start_codon:yes stop_codon:yes gene_type:complete
MFQRKLRRFRRRSNGRDHSSHENGYMQARPRSNSFSNNQIRNNFRQTQSAEKLLEKYNVLAKEAMSSGDKTLGENYLQHADHFMRIIVDKNKNRDQNKVNIIEKTTPDNKPSSEDSNINREDVTKS